MRLDEAIVARAGAAAAITGVVGQKIFWNVRPQGKPLPLLLFRQRGRTEDRTLDGEVAVAESRVDAHCIAKSHAQAWQLEKAVREAFRDPADVGQFWFGTADINGPIDLGEDTEQGFEHDAVLDLLLRHGPDSED